MNTSKSKIVHKDIEEIALNAQESLTSDEWSELCEYQSEWWAKQMADLPQRGIPLTAAEREAFGNPDTRWMLYKGMGE